MPTPKSQPEGGTGLATKTKGKPLELVHIEKHAGKR